MLFTIRDLIYSGKDLTEASTGGLVSAAAYEANFAVALEANGSAYPYLPHMVIAQGVLRFLHGCTLLSFVDKNKTQFLANENDSYTIWDFEINHSGYYRFKGLYEILMGANLFEAGLEVLAPNIQLVSNCFATSALPLLFIRLAATAALDCIVSLGELIYLYSLTKDDKWRIEANKKIAQVVANSFACAGWAMLAFGTLSANPVLLTAGALFLAAMTLTYVAKHTLPRLFTFFTDENSKLQSTPNSDRAADDTNQDSSDEYAAQFAKAGEEIYGPNNTRRMRASSPQGSF